PHLIPITHDIFSREYSFPSAAQLWYHKGSPQNSKAEDRGNSDCSFPSRVKRRLPMQSVLSLILGGGRGTRLYPLTQLRSKPAVPIAGKYRLIDIPISNCINSGLNRVYILTQFLSVSLHRHIANTYKFDPFSQ